LLGLSIQSEVIMLAQRIYFHEEQAICAFPNTPADLERAISTLDLQEGYPVIVLIGGGIQKKQAAVTSAAIQTLAKVAEEMSALVICGGTDMGVMAEIGLTRKQNGYKFPLIGIALKALVTWPGGPRSVHFLWWGKKHFKLAAHYTHFILVPGAEFGDESPWIVDAATLLSKGYRSVTILINGGNFSRKDIELSIEHGRPVIAIDGTGRLANELASEPKQPLITVVPGDAENQVYEAVRAAIAGVEQSASPPDLIIAH
jgi:hypothetical protein